MIDLMLDVFRSLHRAGFREVYCLTGHFDAAHGTAIAQAVRRANDEGVVRARFVVPAPLASDTPTRTSNPPVGPQASEGRTILRHGHTVSHKMWTYEDPRSRIRDFPRKVGSSGWIRTSNPSMWPQIVNPLTLDSLRPECGKTPSSPYAQDGCTGASDERLRHVRSPSRELAVAYRRRGRSVLVRPSIRGARQRPHPMLSARRLSCNPVASGPISGTVCVRTRLLGGPPAPARVGPIRPTVIVRRSSVTRRFQERPRGNHAGIEIAPQRDQ
jgi:hypothetical protein